MEVIIQDEGLLKELVDLHRLKGMWKIELIYHSKVYLSPILRQKSFCYIGFDYTHLLFRAEFISLIYFSKYVLVSFRFGQVHLYLVTKVMLCFNHFENCSDEKWFVNNGYITFSENVPMIEMRV